MSTNTDTTIERLYQVPDNGKAELVDGEVAIMAPTGDAPGRASFKISLRLYEYEQRMGYGRAVANAGFIVDLPHRKSFSPDAAFFIGQQSGMTFLEGAPIFAVEVRSINDYGPAAEREMARKRSDYFSAGTHVVWDVDLLGADVVWVYRADEPDKPTIYRRNELAEAEPAVPGWVMAVNELFA